MIRLMMIILMVFYTFGELVLWGFGPILRNGQKQPPAVFYKKDVLRNFAKFTGKHFPVDFANFLRKPFSQNISG